MKTVSYNDRYGYIVTEDYLQFLESYEAGNVPKQQIDVNGTFIDSDKLYEIIDKADTRATVRTAIKEQEEIDEREKKAPWWLTEDMRINVLFCGIGVIFILYFAWGAAGVALGVGLYVWYFYQVFSRGLGESRKDIIDNYEKERWTRFDRKD